MLLDTKFLQLVRCSYKYVHVHFQREHGEPCTCLETVGAWRLSSEQKTHK